LQDPSRKVDRIVRRFAFKFTLLGGDFYLQTADGFLLKCLDSNQAKLAMGEVHEGIGGTHQSAPRMKWLLQRGGFYWPTMIASCSRYYKGFEECQKFGNIQLVSTAMMHPIIKPWSFRGWGLDFIGQIHPPSLKGHRFMLVAINYFTKWTDETPLKNMMHKVVIEFIIEHIIHRFGIPQTLTTNQGTSLVSGQVREFIESYKIKLLNSFPYYAQANGQAESSNKTLIKFIKKKIEDNLRRCHDVLSEALWAHRISRHGATKVTPFELVYGQEVVLPVEVNLVAYRLAKQTELSIVDYHNLMINNIDEVTDNRLQALKEIEKDKIRVTRAYNKKVKLKSFQVGDLVWKTILLVGTKDHKFEKWSTSWEGPYTIVKVITGNSYMLKTLQGEYLPTTLNGRYLKKYYPAGRLSNTS
jgi:hypothetical protein